jgi:predicted amidophosphoribosyltransferase
MAGSLRNMAEPGPGVCSVCWTFHDPSYDQCAACVGESQLDAVVPISYALRGQQLAGFAPVSATTAMLANCGCLPRIWAPECG